MNFLTDVFQLFTVRSDVTTDECADRVLVIVYKTDVLVNVLAF